MSLKYCQRDIEGESKCEEQCEHCREYFSPLNRVLQKESDKIDLVSQMFTPSVCLTEFEIKVLNKTFKESLIHKPRLPGRK